MIVYIDEAGMDNDDVLSYGWAQKGERLYQLKPGNATQRISIIGGLNSGDFIAPLLFEGYTNSAVFTTYLEKVLIPVLKKGQVVVMDNATFHKGSVIRNLIEAAGCFLKYLPTYSPDFNPIEHCWNPLKNSFRKNLVKCNFDLLQAAEFVFSPIGLI
jgi:transposase